MTNQRGILEELATKNLVRKSFGLKRFFAHSSLRMTD